MPKNETPWKTKSKNEFLAKKTDDHHPRCPCYHSWWGVISRSPYLQQNNLLQTRLVFIANTEIDPGQGCWLAGSFLFDEFIIRRTNEKWFSWSEGLNGNCSFLFARSDVALFSDCWGNICTISIKSLWFSNSKKWSSRISL